MPVFRSTTLMQPQQFEVNSDFSVSRRFCRHHDRALRYNYTNVSFQHDDTAWSVQSEDPGFGFRGRCSDYLFTERGQSLKGRTAVMVTSPEEERVEHGLTLRSILSIGTYDTLCQHFCAVGPVMIAFAFGILFMLVLLSVFPSCMSFVFTDGCMLLRYSSTRLLCSFRA